VAYAGDDRLGASATVLALSGPSPIGGDAELFVVAEEPGVGLGSRLAGLPDIDPGEQIAAGPPDGRVLAARHPTALWPLPAAGEERAAWVGEAKGMWLWLVVWPAAAGVVVYDGLSLVDHREAGPGGSDLRFGTATSRLSA
jgi:hypothetical protein